MQVLILRLEYVYVLCKTIKSVWKRQSMSVHGLRKTVHARACFVADGGESVQVAYSVPVGAPFSHPPPSIFFFSVTLMSLRK